MNNGFKNTLLNRQIKEKQLKRYIFFVIQAISEMKKDLTKNRKKLPNHEEKIRNYLHHYYLQNNMFRDKVGFIEQVRFEIETPENYDADNYIYVGRIDIKILGIESFKKNDAYNIIECKRIDGTKELNKQYINEGVKRFLDLKYSNYLNRNAMLGFVVKSIDISKNTEKIKILQQNDENVNLIEFNQLDFKDTYIYDSTYNDDKLKLWHIFCDISSIIKH